MIKKGLKGLSAFHDKNREVENSPIYIFWEQLNQINGTYSSVPNNVIKMIDLIPEWPDNWKMFIGKYIGSIFLNPRGYFKVFKLVADLDDSSVNVALLSKLASQ